GATMLTLKDVTPVRLIKNKFYNTISEAIQKGATADQQKEILGRGRAKKGMFEGDLDEGELEIGQAAGLIDTIEPVSKIIETMLIEYKEALNELTHPTYNF